nr:MAG TPA: hypothetical protein [Caudoviricetes sp.]
MVSMTIVNNEQCVVVGQQTPRCDRNNTHHTQ